MSLAIPSLSSPSLLQTGTQDLLDLMAKDSARKYVYFNIAIRGTFVGALVVRLYVNICPDTCTRFLEFTRTTVEEKQDYGKAGYINTHIHRIQSPVFLQAGDIHETTPTFSDECFDIVHDRRGVVSFSNVGPDTNKCQFIISLNPNPWMNRKYVAFGQIVEGIIL
uniref:Peptidyl-prolyl cis-trans isomerase n=1 Tax=Cacopsylla melanoneura TaxID=428564 RepID=A0A8D9BNR1_9HEMI